MYARHYALKSALIFTCLGLLFSCSDEKIENHKPIVEVRYQDGRAQLYRHGEPYIIKGAAGTEYLEQVALFGGNSIRTWSLHDADRILDEAHKLGLTVTLGLEIGRPIWGNDFSYWKIWEVDKKIEELRPFIQKYKDHPALLMWGVGNEVKGYGGGRQSLVFFIINRVAKMVKEVDPNHPTMTAVDVPSNEYRFATHRILMPNIDVLGYNAFNTINSMYSKIYGKNGWGKAYILSEWGSSGHWEVTETEWGAPKELKNSEKRDKMEQNWNTITKDSVLFLGSYAFYWGHKHEATHTWFSLFSEEGNHTSSAGFLKYAWTGQAPTNEAPNVNNLFVETDQGIVNDNVYLQSNKEYNAIAYVDDPENDSLRYRWEIRNEGYYYFEPNPAEHKMDYLILEDKGKQLKFTSPKEEGPYRIFIFAYDDKGNVSSHNIPFYVVMK